MLRHWKTNLDNSLYRYEYEREGSLRNFNYLEKKINESAGFENGHDTKIEYILPLKFKKAQIDFVLLYTWAKVNYLLFIFLNSKNWWFLLEKKEKKIESGCYIF